MLNDYIISKSRTIAMKSKVEKAKVSALILHGTDILTASCNASLYGHPSKLTIHAEEWAILKAGRLNLFNRYDKHLSLFVARFGAMGEPRISEPCDACKRLIVMCSNIKEVHYFNLNGEIVSIGVERG